MTPTAPTAQQHQSSAAFEPSHDTAVTGVRSSKQSPVCVGEGRLNHIAQYRRDMDECEGRPDWFACMGEVIARRTHGN